MSQSVEQVPAPRLIETLSLSDQVRNLLLEGLTSGRLRAGDRINEAELARTLGISRNPIREAISGLAQRGFLVASPRRGHFMRAFTPQDVNDVFSFRICVEAFAIRQALPLMDAADHDDLRRIVDRMIAAAEQEDLTELRQADIALHRRICELSQNRQTLRAHEGIDTEVQMLVAYVDLDHETPMEAALAHVPIVEAMASGDVASSVAALEHHLQATWARVLDIYDKTGPAPVRLAGAH
ncbi:GntR family transcriptional regulator [Chelatococcus reniformis]|uniref:GntR family transcriptional regulator n=1 Tax=Chelatococcus reniformis TaxID=1494448 RepID=A0A916X7Y2_9HYPH|nr:GntR family transcriptional regulator [Chelatococcus reniformis]GGC44922.1 GntR family transcriptional regulator [Chelatococcus reniformis]